MKVVFILCLVGITAGFSLTRRKNNGDILNANDQECKDVWPAYACSRFKARGWCKTFMFYGIRHHCCATCGGQPYRRELEGNADEDLELLLEYLFTEQKYGD